MSNCLIKIMWKLIFSVFFSSLFLCIAPSISLDLLPISFYIFSCLFVFHSFLLSPSRSFPTLFLVWLFLKVANRKYWNMNAVTASCSASSLFVVGRALVVHSTCQKIYEKSPTTRLTLLALFSCSSTLWFLHRKQISLSSLPKYIFWSYWKFIYSWPVVL